MSDTTVESRLRALEYAVEGLNKKVELLESRRPGRKVIPILVSEVDVCGVDPQCDSTACTVGSLYRYQKGCRGAACFKANAEYYEAYRKEYKERNRPKDPESLAEVHAEPFAETA